MRKGTNLSHRRILDNLRSCSALEEMGTAPSSSGVSFTVTSFRRPQCGKQKRAHLESRPSALTEGGSERGSGLPKVPELGGRESGSRGPNPWPLLLSGPLMRALGREGKRGGEARSFSALAILRLRSIFAASRQCSQRGFPSPPFTPFVLTALT